MFNVDIFCLILLGTTYLLELFWWEILTSPLKTELLSSQIERKKVDVIHETYILSLPEPTTFCPKMAINGEGKRLE